MPAPVYLSINEFDGDGVTTQHEFAFAGGYIDRTHVKAYITDSLGVITPVTITDGMFVTDNTLDLGVFAPVGGITRIYRETPRNEPLLDFTDNARITAANLDLLARQTVLGVAEAFDAGAYAAANDLLGAAGAALQAAQLAMQPALDADATFNSPGIQSLITNLSKLQDLYTDLSKLIALHTELSKLIALHTSLPALLAVHANLPEINAVYGALTSVVGVFSILSEVQTVAGISAAVSTVATNSAEVVATGANIASVTTVAANMSSILAAIADLPALAAKVSKTGDTMIGPLEVPAGATGAQAGQTQEVAPPGLIGMFARATAPTGWLKANGAAVSRTTYADLFAAIGTTFGVGDGTSTFKLPDMRGEFPRGWDDGRGVDSGRPFGSAQSDALQGHQHGIVSPNDSRYRLNDVGTSGGAGGTSTVSTASVTLLKATTMEDNGTNGVPRVASETRARNVALLACIKY